jgi:hypothetical protein
VCVCGWVGVWFGILRNSFVYGASRACFCLCLCVDDGLRELFVFVCFCVCACVCVLISCSCMHICSCIFVCDLSTDSFRSELRSPVRCSIELTFLPIGLLKVRMQWCVYACLSGVDLLLDSTYNSIPRYPVFPAFAN